MSKNIFSLIKKGDIKRIKTLLDIVNEKDDEGFSPLIYACQFGSLEIVKLLIEYGAKVNDSIINREEIDLDGCTPLNMASSKGFFEIVKVLLENNAKVDDDNNSYETTALLEASERGFFDIVKILIDYKADVNHKDLTGKTALMLASSEGHTKIVELLLKNGAKINEKDYERGETAKDFANKGNYNEIVNLLTKYE